MMLVIKRMEYFFFFLNEWVSLDLEEKKKQLIHYLSASKFYVIAEFVERYAFMEGKKILAFMQ